MSKEKQKLYNVIETLPEELTEQVISYIEYLKLYFLDPGAPESVTIKSKEDLIKKLQKGIEDVEAGRVHSLDETLAKINSI